MRSSRETNAPKRRHGRSWLSLPSASAGRRRRPRSTPRRRAALVFITGFAVAAASACGAGVTGGVPGGLPGGVTGGTTPPPPPPPPAPPVVTGTISGMVVDASGAAMNGATVQLINDSVGSGVPAAAMATPPTGQYAFTVAGGSYSLHITNPGSADADIPGPAVPANQQDFADVAPNDPAWPHAEALRQAGVALGDPCGGATEPCDATNRPYLEPFDDLSRAQATKLVADSERAVVPPQSTQTFADVAPGSFAYDEIEYEASQAATSGFTCGVDPAEPCDAQNRPYFRPFSPMTRGELAKLVALASHAGDVPQAFDTFTDVSGSNPPQAVYIEQLAERGLIAGFACGGPGEPCDAQHREYFDAYKTASRLQAIKLAALTFGYEGVDLLNGLDRHVHAAVLAVTSPPPPPAPAPGGSGWAAVTEATPPTGRSQAAMATRPGATPAQDQIVLFGGVDTSRNASNDTWVFDVSTETWSVAQADTATPGPDQPPRRQSASMAYDAVSRKVLLFGGMAWNGAGYTFFNDTWSWDGSSWTLEQPDTAAPGTNQPDQRSEMAMAVDNSTSEPVLFGGFSAGTEDNDVWRWSNAAGSWLQMIANDPTSTTMPSPRSRAVFALDEAGGTDVLFGGIGSGHNLNDTWTWDGAAGAWTAVQPDTATPAPNQPSQRNDAAMSWDPSVNALILFGGSSAGGPLGDTWQYNSTGWTALTSTTSPPPRSGAVMDHEPITGGGAILYGGVDATGPTLFDDTWRY